MALPADDRPNLKARAWLDALYAGCDGWVTLFALDRTPGANRRHVEWAEVGDWNTLMDHARRLAPTSDVWNGVATRKEKLPNNLRGGQDECLHVPAFWVDIDVQGGIHSRADLPPDMAAGYQLLNEFPLPPTAVIHSGGGLQGWWFLNEPLTVDEAAPLLVRFGATWDELGRRHEWHVDNVFDVPRIMRLPGTWNRKGDEVQVVAVDWDFDRRYGYDDLDQWTIDTPRPTYEVADRRVPYIGPERPGDAFTAVTDPAAVLEAANWTYHHRDQDGGRHYTRPGKDTREGSSATVYADGHVIVWSDSTELKVRRSYDAFGLYAHLRHNGDFTAATTDLRTRGFGASNVIDETWKVQLAEVSVGVEQDEWAEFDATWTPLDLGPALRGELETIKPDVLTRNDGLGLFYRGQVNGIHGGSGTGKSLIILQAAIQEIQKGNHVLWVDAEDPSPAAIAERFRSFGIDPATVLERFHYISPKEPAIKRAVELLLGWVAQWKPTLVVLDSVGELFGLEGINENDDVDVAPWMRRVARPIAEAGPAVVLIDHATKANDNPLEPSGSKRKRAAITGQQLYAEVKVPFAKGEDGSVKLLCGKDRHGNYPRGKPVAIVNVETVDETLTITVNAPVRQDSDYIDVRDLIVGREILRVLKDAGTPLSQAQIFDKIRSVKGSKALKKDAMDVIVLRGCATESGGIRNARLYSYVKEIEE